VLAATPPKRKGIPIRTLLAGGTLFVLALSLAAVMTIRTSYGTLVVETDDPDVQVVVKQNGERVEIADAGNRWTIRLKQGEYELDIADQAGQRFQLAQRSVTVTSGEQRVVKVTLGPPPVDKELAAPRAFIISAGGLGGGDRRTPVSWQPKWAASGVVARVGGRGETAYPR